MRDFVSTLLFLFLQGNFLLVLNCFTTFDVFKTSFRADEFFIKSFRNLHAFNIKQKFCDIAYITFTLIGSEKNISRDLALQFFKENDYFEFDQTPYNKQVLNMLTDKFKYGYKKSIEKKPNITNNNTTNNTTNIWY